MFIKLNADQRELLQNAYSSYLTANTNSGSSTITLTNIGKIEPSTGMAWWVILIGDLGGQTSEFVTISSVMGNVITLSAVTQYSHTEGTKITLLDYDKVEFYYDNGSVPDYNNAVLVDTLDLDPVSYFCTYVDIVNEDGYGWYKFYNSTEDERSDWSNPIPYTDFPENSVFKIMDRFLEDLNDTEQKKLSKDLIFGWISEGYIDLKKKLNIVNSSQSLQRLDITLIPWVEKYNINAQLGSEKYNFSRLQKVIDQNGKEIPKKDYDTTNVSKYPHYYVINDDTIGFDPIPTSWLIYSLYFKSNPNTLTSYWDTIDLPDGNYYIMNDYLLGRSSTKLNRPDLAMHTSIFNEKVKEMQLHSFRQDDTPQSFGFDTSSIA